MEVSGGPLKPIHKLSITGASVVLVPQARERERENHHLLFGGLTLYILTIQFDVVNASSKCSSFISLFPISTPRALSYLSTKKIEIFKTQVSISC